VSDRGYYRLAYYHPDPITNRYKPSIPYEECTIYLRIINSSNLMIHIIESLLRASIDPGFIDDLAFVYTSGAGDRPTYANERDIHI
jgi:hypothetical protein